MIDLIINYGLFLFYETTHGGLVILGEGAIKCTDFKGVFGNNTR